MAVSVFQGSILDVDAEAIVNAANTSLLGGGGVDGVIHRAAGPGLREECRKFGGCPTGEVRVTGAHDLPFRYILHTVGPIWRGGEAGEEELLASCYRSCLAEARRLEIASLAFPAISTGAYSYPVEKAARVAARECTACNTPDVVLVAIDRGMASLLSRALNEAEA